MHILHISDLHILPETGATLYGLDTFKSLEAVLKDAFSRGPTPDLIIATGDLAEDASIESYNRLRNLFCETNTSAFVLPGNHDSTPAIMEGLISDKIQMRFSFSTEDWNFVFLNTQVPGESHGSLSENELRALEMIASAEPDKPVLVAFHHSPLTLCPYPGCQLDNKNVLFDILERHSNIRCVISGHAHEDRQYLQGNSTLFTTPATSANAVHLDEERESTDRDFWESHKFDPERVGYRLIELIPDGSLKSEVYWI